jgi:hypothetical protein
MATGLDELLVLELVDEDVLVVVDNVVEFVALLPQDTTINVKAMRKHTVNKYRLSFILSPLV